MTRAAKIGDLATARALHLKYYPLARILFAEPSPGPIKEALTQAGLISSAEVRLPLAPITPETRDRLFGIMESLDLRERVRI